MANLTAEEILDLKERLEQEAAKLERIKGIQENLMQQLKDNYGCETLEGAKEKLEELSQREEDLEDMINSLVEELNKKIG